jgi:hypothetical protein
VIARLKQHADGFDLRDMIFLACGAAVTWGIHLLCVAAAWIFAGALGMYLTVQSAPPEQPEEPTADKR